MLEYVTYNTTPSCSDETGDNQRSFRATFQNIVVSFHFGQSSHASFHTKFLHISGDQMFQMFTSERIESHRTSKLRARPLAQQYPAITTLCLKTYLSKDVDFHTKSTTKLCVQSCGTPALLFSSIATSSPKSCNFDEGANATKFHLHIR